MERVTVELNPTWRKLIRSPLYWLRGPLWAGACFSPLFLYLHGLNGVELSDWRVEAFFAVNLLALLYFASLSQALETELRRKTTVDDPGSSHEPSYALRFGRAVRRLVRLG